MRNVRAKQLLSSHVAASHRETAFALGGVKNKDDNRAVLWYVKTVTYGV